MSIRDCGATRYDAVLLSLTVAVAAVLFVLLACDDATPPDDAPDVLMPMERVLVSSGAGPGSTLSIPRYKAFQHPVNVDRIWVGLSLASGGNDTFETRDGGATWDAVGAVGWEMHMSLAGNAEGYVHFVNRGSPAAQYRQLFDGAFQADAATEFADYGAQTTSGNIAVNGREVVVFTRNRDDNSSRIVWHRSTDNGSTWTHGSVAGTGNPSGGLHRIGSCVIDGEITLVYWTETGTSAGDSITLHRWNGSAFARVPGAFATEVSNPYTRQFGVTQDAAGLIHLAVWDLIDGRRVVRHSTRTLTAGWSEPQTVAAWENDDIHPQLSAYGNSVLLLYLYHPDSGAAERAQVYYNVWEPGLGWRPSGVPLYEGERPGARYPVAPQVTPEASPFVPVVWTQGDAVHFMRLGVR